MEPFGGEHTRKVRVAWLYYVEGLTQDAIAAQLGMTRIRVQRLLAQARDEGLVRITITDPIAETIALAAELKRLFGLNDALVTPAPVDPAYIRRFIGHAAAEYLADCLHDGMSLGVGWGMTLEETARALPSRLLDRFSVVSLMGGLTRSSALNPHEIAWQLARTLCGECFYLAAPTYADSLMARDAILGESAIRDVLERGRTVDVALVSVGAFGPDSTMRTSGLLNDDDARALEQAGAVGDLLGSQIDAAGRVVTADINDRVIALSPAALRAIKTVLLVSGGEDKTAIIGAALHGRYVDVLITDEATAARLVGAERERTATQSARLPAVPLDAS